MGQRTDGMTRTVLVTGASSGIGREVAVRLAGSGVSVALAARRRDELEETEWRCREAGAPATVVVPTDVTDPGAVDAAFRRAAEAVGPVGGVVHAAGVAAYGRFEEIPADVFERVHQVNLFGTANVARAAFRHFDSQGLRGSLVVFGSLVGRISAPFFAPYVSSKWAVHGFVRTLQAEQAVRGHQGHRVSLVAPGGVDTTIYQKAASYLGVQGSPPWPVDDTAKVARATVALLESPRRHRSVGPLNPVISLGFRTLPFVYDRLAAPLMRRMALDDVPVADHRGNLFEATAEPSRDEDAPTGRSGR